MKKGIVVSCRKVQVRSLSFPVFLLGAQDFYTEFLLRHAHTEFVCAVYSFAEDACVAIPIVFKVVKARQNRCFSCGVYALGQQNVFDAGRVVAVKRNLSLNRESALNFAKTHATEKVLQLLPKLMMVFLDESNGIKDVVESDTDIPCHEKGTLLFATLMKRESF